MLTCEFVEALRHDHKWYAVRTMARREKLVEDMAKEITVEAYCPLLIQYRKWSDRIKKVKTPMFPTYVFVRISLTDKIKILRIPGVRDFVSFDHQIVSIRPEIIKQICQIEKSEYDVQSADYYSIGQEVIVTSGSLCSYRGIVIRRLDASRLIIKIDVLKLAVSVTLPEECLAHLRKGDFIR